MFDRLRNNKKRVAVEIAVLIAGFWLVRYLFVRLLDAGDGTGRSTTIVVALAVVVGLGLAVLLIGLPMALITTRRTVESIEIQEGAPDGWPPASFAMQQRFTSMGFEQIGSIDVTLPDHVAVFAALLSPDGTTIAVVTPVHLTFISDFDGKLLNTTNKGAGAPTRYELRQCKRDASPENAWELHQAGIGAVAEAGMWPTIFNARSAMSAFVAMEQYSTTQFVMSDQIRGVLGRTGAPLARDRNRTSRIGAWRDSPYRWKPKVS